MAAVKDLRVLLKNMTPEIQSDEYVFCPVKSHFSEYEHLNPLAFFVESEGVTLIVSADAAEKAGLSFETKFKQITLTVHSSLDAVGLTAAVTSKLAAHGINANVVAAYYHDHIFVQTEKADKALSALKELSANEQ